MAEVNLFWATWMQLVHGNIPTTISKHHRWKASVAFDFAWFYHLWVIARTLGASSHHQATSYCSTMRNHRTRWFNAAWRPDWPETSEKSWRLRVELMLITKVLLLELCQRSCRSFVCLRDWHVPSRGFLSSIGQSIHQLFINPFIICQEVFSGIDQCWHRPGLGVNWKADANEQRDLVAPTRVFLAAASMGCGWLWMAMDGYGLWGNKCMTNIWFGREAMSSDEKLLTFPSILGMFAKGQVDAQHTHIYIYMDMDGLWNVYFI